MRQRSAWTSVRRTGSCTALGSFSRLYTVNTTTGAASLVGALGLALNGTAFGFDFNPSIDRIRVVSESDRNYVLHPDTGIATQVTNLFYGPADPNFGVNPNVVGSAYSNNIAGTPTTQLYGIDTNLDILVTQANSAGTLGTVGPIGRRRVRDPRVRHRAHRHRLRRDAAGDP